MVTCHQVVILSGCLFLLNFFLFPFFLSNLLFLIHDDPVIINNNKVYVVILVSTIGTI